MVGAAPAPRTYARQAQRPVAYAEAWSPQVILHGSGPLGALGPRAWPPRAATRMARDKRHKRRDQAPTAIPR